jgi:hypothetical protein
MGLSHWRLAYFLDPFISFRPSGLFP